MYYVRSMPFSVRLDLETERLIARLARERGLSRSHVVREAVAVYGAAADEGASVHERFKRAIGMVDSGGRQLSTQSGRKVKAILEAKRRGENPRGHRSTRGRPRPK